MAKIKGHVICHTHWDREWYLTREVFRTKLVRLIDKVLDIIESQPGYVSFMMDGQTVSIGDYLEIRPENEERLKRAMQSGRLISGPWYVLPDELLISGESHIRNFMIGTKVAKKYGRPMNVAYLPDSFGHPEQMPQIVKGLGMDAMVFWRGTSNEMTKSEFIWNSAHEGSNILCIHMPFGYGNSARLSKSEDVVPRLNAMAAELRKKSQTASVLLMNGSDHITAQEDIGEIVDYFNVTCSDVQICLSTLEGYINEVKPQLRELPAYSGELRFGDRTMLLGGTLSSRMMLKQRNHTVQKKTERYLEPIVLNNRLLGDDSRSEGFSYYLWKRILENQPHDSICGCSIDEVHTEMLQRFDCVEQLEDEIIGHEVSKLEARLGRSGEKADAQLYIFEPAQDMLPDYVETDIDLDPMLVQDVDFARSIIVDREADILHPELPEGIVVKDGQGRELEHVILGRSKEYYQLLQDETMPEIYKVNRLKVGIHLPGFDYGTHILNIYRTDKKEKDPDMDQSENKIENEFYSIEFDCHDSSLTILDKSTGKLHKGVHRFVDKGDAGDEYTYSWPENDCVFSSISNVKLQTSAKGDLERILIISGTLTLPVGLTDDRKRRSSNLVASPVTLEVALYKNVDRIDFKTMFENRSGDHRLQVRFPSGVLAEKSASSGAFAVTGRYIAFDVPENWMEYPQSTHPTHGFVDCSTKEYGLSVASKGMAEYEAENCENQTFINLTLLRCVGWLSRTDLLTRRGNGGWTIETPGAQCRGLNTFEYSITYHEGGWENSTAYQWCERALHRSLAVQFRMSGGALAMSGNPLGFISQLPPQVRLSAAKPADSGEGAIIRIYSISGKQERFTLKLPDILKEVYSTDLKETRLTKLSINGGELDLRMEPGQICTFEFVYKELAP